MKIFMGSLKNNRERKIFLDMEQAGNILFHLRDGEGHITGYYLMGMDDDGMFLVGDIGTTDSRNDNIESIDLDCEEHKLKIVGVDLI